MNSSHIKILFVSHEASIGGSTVSLTSLIQGLKKYDNVDLKILLPQIKGNAFQLLKKNEIGYKKIWYFRNFKRIAEEYSLKFHIFDFMNKLAVKKIQHYIKKEKFDIVCSNSTGVDVGARAARLAKVPHIYYVREMMELGLNCEFRNKKRMKKLLEESDYTIFISKTTEKYYTANYKLKDTVQFFDGFVIQDYFLKNHNILEGEKIAFVQVGTFSDVKGVLDTIEMLHKLSLHGINNWNMEFVGKGTEKYVKEMLKLIAEYQLESQITIGEFCSNMKEKLSSKDILIMNSKAEGFGRVTVEGMLAGCLVIGRYSGGTTEIMEDGVNGITFEKDGDFINAIQKIDTEREKYRKLAKSGQKYAMEKFDCINTAKNFVRVVEDCVNHKKEI